MLTWAYLTARESSSFGSVRLSPIQVYKEHSNYTLNVFQVFVFKSYMVNEIIKCDLCYYLNKQQKLISKQTIDQF